MASTSSSISKTNSVQRPVKQKLAAAKETMSKIKLVTWDQLPDWQKDNHYIISGYVPQTDSYKKCVSSLSYIHNETVNIYTHLVPSLVAIVMLVTLMLFVLFYSFEIVTGKDIEYLQSLNSGTDSDRFWLVLPDSAAFSIFGFGVASCLGLSATFHTLKSHSHPVSTFGNQLDYLGIVVLIVTSMVSIINYSFMEYPVYRIFFWSLTGVLGSICATVSLKSRFRIPEWRTFRASMFVLFGLSGVFPVITQLYVLGFSETWRRSQLFYLLMEAFLYISGAAIYAARIPERWAPGKYDLFGHSHQTFHVLVVLAALSHGIGLYNAAHIAHNVKF